MVVLSQEAEVQTVDRLVRAEGDVGDGSGGRREVVLSTWRGCDRYSSCAGERPGEGVGTIFALCGRDVDGLAIHTVDPGEGNDEAGQARVPGPEGGDALEGDLGRAIRGGRHQRAWLKQVAQVVRARRVSVTQEPSAWRIDA